MRRNSSGGAPIGSAQWSEQISVGGVSANPFRLTRAFNHSTFIYELSGYAITVMRRIAGLEKDGMYMVEKIKELLIKYKEIIIYLIVGVLNTIVSWGACFLVEWLLLDPDISWQNDIINTIGWVAGVLFAYPMNRKFVFESKNPKIFKEFCGFAASRLSTWLLDIVIMRITVNVLEMHYWIAKLFISSVLVMILNYVFSKVFIFKKKNTEK